MGNDLERVVCFDCRECGQCDIERDLDALREKARSLQNKHKIDVDVVLLQCPRENSTIEEEIVPRGGVSISPHFVGCYCGCGCKHRCGNKYGPYWRIYVKKDTFFPGSPAEQSHAKDLESLGALLRDHQELHTDLPDLFDIVVKMMVGFLRNRVDTAGEEHSITSPTVRAQHHYEVHEGKREKKAPVIRLSAIHPALKELCHDLGKEFDSEGDLLIFLANEVEEKLEGDGVVFGANQDNALVRKKVSEALQPYASFLKKKTLRVTPPQNTPTEF